MNTQPLELGFKLLKNSYRFGVAALLSVAFLIASTMQVSASPQVTFNGTGVGAIPDGAGTFPNCQQPGQPLNITFNVNGLTGNVQTVAVTVTFSPIHTYGGDIVATLISPNGAQLDLFGYTRASTATGAGDASALGGPYTFSDAATQNWWAAAQATSDDGDVPIPAGSYRTTQRGGPGSTGAATSLNTTFGGLTAAQANGNWTLRVTDGCMDDTGSVSAAVLDITTGGTQPVAAKPFGDFFGSGKSSFALLASNGTNLLWRLKNNGGTGQETLTDWGLNSQTFADVPTPGYFDADNRTDIAVWRPSTTAGESRFFIRQSASNTLNAIPFGRGGTGTDFAGFDADYDGDGRDDPTTIRRDSNRWLWNYLASSTNTLRSFYFGRATGDESFDDVPMAGADFSGDGRADFVVLRQNASGDETYIWGNSAANEQVLGSFIFGEFDTDYYVMGDFLGDARFDFAVWRGFGAGTDGNWYIRENGGTGFVARNFGIPGATAAVRDVPISGDFGGDSKYDIAVYRPSNNTFYWLNTPTATTTSGQRFGQPGDVPVGRLRVY